MPKLSRPRRESSSIHPLAVEFLGRSDAFLACSEEMARIARIDRPALIVGERGAGKELAAARLHYLSARWQSPLVALNCAALAPTLIESELFGHEAGAFTGAAGRRVGRFEAADRGTIFLDEIGAMPLEVQEKILRVVEYGVFERVGGVAAVEVNVRIIGATNLDLPSLAARGKFKRDLLDRLSFEVLTLPPLRARVEDIQLLAEHFAARMAVELGRSEPARFTDAAMAQLMSHPWPGNVRELKNVVERSVARSELATIERVVFDPFDSPYRPSAPETDATAGMISTAQAHAAQAPFGLPIALSAAVAALEREALAAALAAARHNQRVAAGLLGLGYNQFRNLYRKYKAPLKPAK